MDARKGAAEGNAWTRRRKAEQNASECRHKIKKRRWGIGYEADFYRGGS
ncbi:MAG: hypothetical protein NC409_01315 [Clostridium sp.]|nr:hypothetical protein [Clostridium sp.]